jgi:hypothetical protein
MVTALKNGIKGILGECDGFLDAVECFPVEARDDGLYVGLPGSKTGRSNNSTA